MSRILKPVTYVLAALYFLVDAVFVAVARPVSNWIARRIVFRRLRIWIRSLSPYASLALFSVPVMILEPIKPLAAYLAATGQWLVGAEADLDWSNIRGTFNGTAGAAAFSLSSQLNWLDTTRVQVGWVWDHALFYGTAGAAAGGVTTTASASAAIAGSARRLPLPIRKLASAGPPVAASSMPSTTISVPRSNTCT